MRWFTSDLHFNHDNIIDYSNRPFRDVKHMNEMLVHNWNVEVAKDDEVYVVGDFAMGQVEHTLHYAERLNGKKFLVPGNHDKIFRGRKPLAGWEIWDKRYQDVGFTLLESQHILQIANQKVLLCHFPYFDTNARGSRYSGNWPPDEGLWLIHGHTHSHNATNFEARMIHVGVDAWDYRPVPEPWIIAIIGEGFNEESTVSHG